MTGGREYGSRARIGMAVPQANPVVEPEMNILFPSGVSVLATRLVNPDPEPRLRFIGYIEDLGKTLASYDTLKLDALGFACTASSYLVGAAREAELIAGFSARYGYPIVTGGAAILEALAALNVERVAVVAPYPQFVVDAGAAYLQAAGLDIVAKHRVVTRTSDTRTIYELGSDDALAAVRELDLGRAQCVLFTGTGMPSLRAIDTLAQSCDLPVLSTSLCMAWALAKRVQLELPPGPHPLLNGWQSRIGQL